LRLTSLIQALPLQSIQNQNNPEILDITIDSRKVKQGSLFIALTGSQVDGHLFIPQAIAQGASAIILEKTIPGDFSIPLIRVDSSRIAFSLIMQAWYGYPSQAMQLTAVTGSNGKTTTAYLLYSLFNRLIGKTGLIGTAGYFSGTDRLDTPLTGPVTTPDPNELQKLFKSFLQDQCCYAVMEASSFGIVKKRLSGMAFETILWTNFTPTHHILYHGSEEDYFIAKQSLLQQIKPEGLVILNRDMDGFSRITSGSSQIESVGFHPESDLMITALESTPERGIHMKCRYHGQSYEFSSPLVGNFQAYNIGQAFLAMNQLGVHPADFSEALRFITQIPGRWEIIEVPKIPFTVIIDKANTVASLEAFFHNLQQRSFHRKILVYGQVGGGESTQRIKTGSLFHQHFDRIILTTDDPENEDPMIGIQQFMQGVPISEQKKVSIQLDREKAITEAYLEARPNDLVAVLGRGNQREFLNQGRTEIFDDTEQCRKILMKLGWIE